MDARNFVTYTSGLFYYWTDQNMRRYVFVPAGFTNHWKKDTSLKDTSSKQMLVKLVRENSP